MAALRAGFFYEPTPVPATLVRRRPTIWRRQGLISVPTRFFDTSRYVLSVGGGVDLGNHAPFTVDFWAQYHLLARPAGQSLRPGSPVRRSSPATSWPTGPSSE